MSVPHRPLVLLALVAAVCALSAPVALASAPTDGRGVVLSLERHTVHLVDKAHRVGGVHVRSAHGLRRGDVVRVQRGRARVTGHARRIAFLGRVVRASARRAVLRLDDGSTFALTGGGRPHGRGARVAGDAGIDLRSLTPGETVLVSIAVATGSSADVAVTIKRQPSGTKRGGKGERGAPRDDEACDDEASAEDDEACGGDLGADDEWDDAVDGTVTALAGDGSSLTIALDDGGGEETYPVDDPVLLDEIAVGDEVTVYLDEDGVAVDVEPLDWAEDPGPGEDDGGEE